LEIVSKCIFFKSEHVKQNPTDISFLVIVAKSKRNERKYVRKKKLEGNVEKTKMMVFDKRKRKSEEDEWN
jgi:hypothetical protein